jgi:hypothetical protein
MDTIGGENSHVAFHIHGFALKKDVTQPKSLLSSETMSKGPVFALGVKTLFAIGTKEKSSGLTGRLPKGRSTDERRV